MIEPVERASFDHLLRRGVATLFDYGLYAAVLAFYLRAFGEVIGEGSYRLEGGHHLLILLALWVILLPVPEGLWGRGFGKYLLALRVLCRETGKPPGMGAALKRTAAGFVEIAMCGGLLALAVIVSTHSRQRLGDLWADTVVMSEDEPHVPGANSPATLPS